MTAVALLDVRCCLPCRSCFGDWWCWQQQALSEQQQQLEQRTGATAAAALAQVGCRAHSQLTATVGASDDSCSLLLSSDARMCTTLPGIALAGEQTILQTSHAKLTTAGMCSRMTPSSLCVVPACNYCCTTGAAACKRRAALPADLPQLQGGLLLTA